MTGVRKVLVPTFTQKTAKFELCCMLLGVQSPLITAETPGPNSLPLIMTMVRLMRKAARLGVTSTNRFVVTSVLLSRTECRQLRTWLVMKLLVTLATQISEAQLLQVRSVRRRVLVLLIRWKKVRVMHIVRKVCTLQQVKCL